MTATSAKQAAPAKRKAPTPAKKPPRKRAPPAKKPAPKGATSTAQTPTTMVIGVAQVPGNQRDSELAEEWTRTIADPGLRYVHGVTARKWQATSPWPWRIHVSVMELVRGNALDAELRARITAAVRAVRGVTDVAAEDREPWVIAGAPSGQALVTAVAKVVDDLAGRALAVIQQTR